MADGSRSRSLKSLQSKKTQKNLQVGQSSNPIVFNSLWLLSAFGEPKYRGIGETRNID